MHKTIVSFILLTLIALLIQGCAPRFIDTKCYGDGRFYYRYFNENSPPIEEFYVLTDDGFLLEGFDYDSDGDWYPDVGVTFPEDLKDESIRIYPIPKTSAGKFVINDSGRLKYTTNGRIKRVQSAPPVN